MAELSAQLTEVLRAWTGGDESAFAKVIELAYPELREIARRCLRMERSEHTLQATALVHEAYLRLMDARNLTWQDRAHFFAVAASIMRRILVDHARAKGRAKRGGGMRQVNLDAALMVTTESDPELVRLDEALEDLATFDPRKARVVELRYFGGLTSQEAAAVLRVSLQTINRDWSLAKAWLIHELRRKEYDGRPPVGNH
jgi:RNA polymerase sigma factor (TIGR02999 family)